MNGTTRETYYSDILKIALAFAVIRTKPEHMTAKVYSQLIASKLIKDEIKWRSKAKTLEEELLLVKEELFQVKLSLHNLPQTTTEETYTSIPVQDVTSEVESSSMECLTPPCSSESNSTEKHTKSQNRHIEFLKSIVALRDAPETAEMLANSDMCASITSTVLQAVSVLRDSVNDQCFIETHIPECCVDALLGVLDMEIPNTGSSKVTKKVLEYVEGMIQATMNHKVDENDVPQEKYSKLLVRLACHEKTTELVLSKLINVLKDFSKTLRVVSQEPTKLGDNLGKYKNIYHILCSIENILTQRLEYGLTEAVSISLMESLEDSVLHLSKTFPLFTHWVWRIGGLLSRTNKREMGTG